MTDIISPEERSKNMSAIRSKNTSPEIFFRKWLFNRGYRYSLHSKKLPGHPDLYMKKYNTAIFIHGCFWHRHSGCKYSYTPKSHVEKWNKKFSNNIFRDNEVRVQLHNMGVKVLVIWECSIKEMKKDPVILDKNMKKVEEFLHAENSFMEI